MLTSVANRGTHNFTYNKNRRYSFNCYGYAIGIPRWLIVRHWESLDDLFWPPPIGHAKSELLNSLSGKNSAKWLELKNPHWRRVRKSELQLGRTYIAYRFGARDFHFCVRLPSGHWRHKRGTHPPVAISQKEVLNSPYWVNFRGKPIYTSKVYLWEVGEVATTPS